MTGIGNESWLWWTMLATGLAGAGLSIATGVFDRRRVVWPNQQQRLLLHLVSYGLMTLSILAFILRGLIAPA